jgi:hypothetical protein
VGIAGRESLMPKCNKRPGMTAGASSFVGLQGVYICCLWPLGAIGDVELHLLAFL